MKVTKAPGALAQAQSAGGGIGIGFGGGDGAGQVNDNMYIVETVQTIGDVSDGTGASDASVNMNVQAMLAQFRQTYVFLVVRDCVSFV